MSRPFPATPERKREAYAAMVREAPALMPEIAALIKQFPGSRLTHFKAGNLELGDAPKDGWRVDEDLRLRVAERRRKDGLDTEFDEAQRKLKKQLAASKSKRGKT